MGNLLAVIVHAANLHDTKSGINVAQEACRKYPSIQGFCADAGYRGTFVGKVKSDLQRSADISEKIKPREWEKLPWRWIVERTFAWMNASRRLSKDFEISIASQETMVILSHLAVLLHRF